MDVYFCIAYWNVQCIQQCSFSWLCHKVPVALKTTPLCNNVVSILPIFVQSSENGKETFQTYSEVRMCISKN